MNIKEYNLIKITLILFLFLFALIYYLDSNYSPKLIQISQIDKTYLNKYVKINAKITKQIQKNKTSFLILSQIQNKSNKINAIIFNNNKILKKNKQYQIIGKISIYKNKEEILINKITIKS